MTEQPTYDESFRPLVRDVEPQTETATETAAPVSTVDPYWTQMAESKRAAEAAKVAGQAQGQAQQQIDAKLRDKDFAAKYFGEYVNGHGAAVAEMAALYATLHGEAAQEPAPIREPVAVRPEAEKPEVEKPKTPDELQDEAARARIDEETEQLLGSRVTERIAGARQWLGPELVEAIEDAGFGNDPQAIAEVVQLSESDTDGALRAAISELLAKNIYHGAASLERKRLEADQAFMDAYVKGHHPGHDAALAKMHALAIVERPPAWATAMMEKLHHAQTRTQTVT